MTSAGFPAAAPTLLVGGGLVLRPWFGTDVEAVCEACQDPEIQRWTPAPTPYTRADAERVVGRSIASWDAGRGGYLALVDPVEDRASGWFGIVDLDADARSAELGYWLAAPLRGRGIATRALDTLVEYSFEVGGLDSVYLRIDPANEPSAALARRSGFIRTASRVVGARSPEPLDTYTRLAED
ncbi:GNAT family N-acetyltransferase [Mycetocola saprophilus]|uniref:GNAT family N-acetyltransferase n=1 Tax=Mycetocola saprophilus TaxID=76636 RepID=UPI003BF3EF2A